MSATDKPESPRRNSTERAIEILTPPEKQGERREIGGPKGPEPTRYGDWERKGRCVDF
ncbi:succinate dehydrogenase assembly factor 4 [Methylomonas sp. LWB]|uniref:DUF1674 domain-containing protein n=1 Tax=Methylomonas sp. LWB TaxID=1905845 RepID=UPI000A664EA0